MSEEIPEAVVVGIQSEVFATFQVVAESFDGVDDGKEFTFMDGVIFLRSRIELSRLIADWLITLALVLEENCTNGHIRGISVKCECSIRTSERYDQKRS